MSIHDSQMLRYFILRWPFAEPRKQTLFRVHLRQMLRFYVICGHCLSVCLFVCSLYSLCPEHVKKWIEAGKWLMRKLVD